MKRYSPFTLHKPGLSKNLSCFALNADMKKFPIQENLTTASVNPELLVSFLRDLGFVGSIHIELPNYDADITFTHANFIAAREHDRITGKIAYGEDTLARILIRAKEPCGRIHVYQAEEIAVEDSDEIFVAETITAGALKTGTGIGNLLADCPEAETADFRPLIPVVINGMVFSQAKPELEIPTMPPRTAVVTSRSHASSGDWNELLDVTAELLRTIDESLEKANFQFPEALENACAIISRDHPFIDPDSGGFQYKDGLISTREQVAPEVFANGITEALKRIFERLREESRFSRVYRSTIIRIRLLLLRRQEQFDKFLFTPRLDEILID